MWRYFARKEHCCTLVAKLKLRSLFRYLIQQATGFLTGSVYQDQTLRINGFPGSFCRKNIVPFTNLKNFEVLNHIICIIEGKNYTKLPNETMIPNVHNFWQHFVVQVFTPFHFTYLELERSQDPNPINIGLIIIFPAKWHNKRQSNIK